MVVPYRYPEPIKSDTIEMGMMKLAEERTLSVHGLSGLVLHTGRAGIGKTTTAMWMVKRMNEGYDPSNPKAFRAAYFELGAVNAGYRNEMQEMKRGIRCLYVNTIGPIDEGYYRSSRLPDEYARQTLIGLQSQGIQMLFVDEAGCLTLNAIRGIVLVCDHAKQYGWPLTVVMVGMDDLPIKLNELPQIKRRVYATVYFKPYNLADTKKMLRSCHPYFAELSDDEPSHEAQFGFIHNQYEGIPGGIIPFIHRFAAIRSATSQVDGMTVIQAAHMQHALEMERALADCRKNYKADLKTILSDKPNR